MTNMTSRTQSIVQFLRLNLVSKNHRFTIQCHPVESDISEIGDTIECSELPDNKVLGADVEEIDIFGYTLEQAIDDCINQNPINESIICFIGDYSDQEIRTMIELTYDWSAQYANTTRGYFITESTQVVSPDGTSSHEYSHLAILAHGDNQRSLIRLSESVEVQPYEQPKFYSKIGVNLTSQQIENAVSGTEVNLDALAAFWSFTRFDHSAFTTTAKESQEVAYLNSNTAVTTANFVSLNAFFEGNTLPDPNEYTLGEVRIEYKDSHWYVLDVAESIKTGMNSVTSRGYIAAVFSDDLTEIETPKPIETLTIGQLLSGNVSISFYAGDNSEMVIPKYASLEVFIDHNIKLSLPAIAD